MPSPTFSIIANGKDVTENFIGAGVTMTITDGEGYKADALTIVLDDIEGTVEAPETGATINPLGGYQGFIRDFGEFVVDTVSYQGWPQTITINAKPVAAKSATKERKPKAYSTKEYPTYGDIFEEVAGEIELKLEMSAELKGIANPYEAQSEEDALEFLTRLGDKIGAVVSVKSGRIVVVEKGSGKSASGDDLDFVCVAPGFNLLNYTVNEKDEPKHSKVEASYYDRTRNAREIVIESTGMDGPTFLMRAPFQDREEAQRAALATARELIRSIADATFDIEGDPFAQAEAKVFVSGVRSRVNGIWRAKVVTHTFSATTAFTTTLECERPNGDAPAAGTKLPTSSVSSSGAAPDSVREFAPE